jgi:sulfur-carrier protein
VVRGADEQNGVGDVGGRTVGRDSIRIDGTRGFRAYAGTVPVVRLFAAARQAAGTGRVELAGSSVDDVLAAAVTTFGPAFEQVLATCKVWVNGDEADRSRQLRAEDEVAVLPPVSGGA